MLLYFDVLSDGYIVQTRVDASPEVAHGVIVQLDDSVPNALSAVSSPSEWRYVTGSFVYAPTPDSMRLPGVRQSQIALLTGGYNATLMGGFTSSADGTVRVYAADPEALTELGWVRNLPQASYPAGGVGARLVDGTHVTLTYAQMQTLVNDAQTFFLAQRSQRVSLMSQIQAAITISAVQALVWTAATY